MASGRSLSCGSNFQSSSSSPSSSDSSSSSGSARELARSLEVKLLVFLALLAAVAWAAAFLDLLSCSAEASGGPPVKAGFYLLTVNEKIGNQSIL